MQVILTKEKIDNINFERNFTIDSYGAVVSFNGYVRNNVAKTIRAIEVEQYPILTQKSLEQIVTKAIAKFDILDCSVCHRVGLILLNELIVNVIVVSNHRQEAFDACQYIMDCLKNDALLWKKEYMTDNSYSYVDIKQSDIDKKKLWN